LTEISNETRFLHAIEMGLGAWQWGDRIVWAYGQTHTDLDVRAAFDSSLEQGVRFVDTAEIYGSGRSERLLGQFLKETEQPVVIATKFFPWPWRLLKSSIPNALKASLTRMGVDTVDLYQIHFPGIITKFETMMDGLVECVKSGKTRTVGISNFGQIAMLRAYTTLARYNIPLASNQVHYSLLNRVVEKDGTLARCKELGIRLIAYSPLEMGMLTGKYTPENPPKGTRAGRYITMLGKIAPLLKLMTAIGQDHGGKSNAQVALNWLIRKGTLPIPGAKNAAQAQHNAGALGWKLTKEQVAKLDEASDLISK
jgi:aryl-alcohol dehydrogenase-like predicted oxidoreductase